MINRRLEVLINDNLRFFPIVLVSASILSARGCPCCSPHTLSSSTYNGVFEKGFRSLTNQLDAQLTRRAVIYCGTQERRDSHIEVLNFASLLSV